jgi:hypothetical protein
MVFEMSPILLKILAGKKVVDISAGVFHSVVLTGNLPEISLNFSDSNEVLGLGRSQFGQLGTAR